MLEPATGVLMPAAKAGDDAGIVIGEAIRHCGCTLDAIQQARPCVINEMQSDSRAVLCREQAGKAGLRACAAYPIRLQGQVCGVLVVGTAESGFFNDAESRLLDEIALDISFALDIFEANANTGKLKRRCGRVRKRTVVPLNRRLSNRPPYTGWPMVAGE